MKLYQCGHCAHPVYFENTGCENCGYDLAYFAPGDRIVAQPAGGTTWTPAPDPTPYQYCENHAHGVCNWLVPAGALDNGLCTACDLNRTIPNLSRPANVAEWGELETAKHRLVYALLRLGLPVVDRLTDPEHGLAFDFLSPADSPEPVLTGHDAGLITMNLTEADPVTREANRVQLDERYRTLIGHFRHEVGHYYWDRLVATDDHQLALFRRHFGDERADYQEALDQHYANGAPADWATHYISAYATMHPWEDWAETWAHYLHLLDLVETAHHFGLSVAPAVDETGTMTARADFDPYAEADLDRILAVCVPLTYAVNSLNRGMGRPDLYPFVLNESVREKLGYVHQLVRTPRGNSPD